MTIDNDNPSTQFLPFILHKFKPICDKIVSDPKKQDIKDFHYLLDDSESFYLQNIQQFLLIPLLTKIGSEVKGKMNTEIRTDVIYLVKKVIDKTEIRNTNAFKSILTVLIKEVYNFKEARLIPGLSEELIISVLKCLEAACKKLSSDCVEEFYQSSNSAQISQLIFAILLTMDENDFRDIKFNAINTLLAILRVHDKADFGDFVLRNQIANIIFFSLPKLWSSLSKIALGEKKQGENLIKRSVIALGRIVCLIMEDDKSTDQEPEIGIEDFKRLTLVCSNEAEQHSKILKSRPDSRSKSWLKAASNKLKNSFKELISLVGSDHSGIRLEIGNSCFNWMHLCYESLSENIETFIEIILILSEDEDQAISHKFKEYFHSLTQDSKFNHVFKLTRDLIRKHVRRLPRIVRRQNKREQILGLSLLKAQMDQIPEQEMLSLLTDSAFLDEFISVLLFSVTLDYSNEFILKQEHSIRECVNYDQNFAQGKPWRRFLYISNENKSFKLLEEICSHLGKSESVRIIIDYLLNLFYERVDNLPEVVILINMIIKTSKNGELIEQIANEFINEEFWSLSLEVMLKSDRNENSQLVMSSSVEGLYESALQVSYKDSPLVEDLEMNKFLISPREAKTNVLLTCSLMESLADFAENLGSKDFHKILFRILYRILCKAGNKNVCIYFSAVSVLEQLSLVYGFKSIEELLIDNTDYIIYFINYSLKYPDQVNSALEAISVVLEFCPKNVFGYLEMILNSLLNECAQFHKIRNLSSYLKVFGLFLKAIKEDNETTSMKNPEKKEILDLWNEMLNKKTEEEVDLNEDNNQTEKIEEDPPKAELPKRVILAKQIIEVSLKHISSQNTFETIDALMTTHLGIEVLKDFEDELLPLVHQIWYPLAKRFKTDDAVVLRNCFKLLISLCENAKDFIRRRTTDDIIPILNGILKSNSNKFSTGSEGGIRFTQQFLLTKEILENYHKLLVHLDIQEKSFDDILEAAVIYLNKSQYATISLVAKDLFENLLSYDGAAVYQKLAAHNLLTKLKL